MALNLWRRASEHGWTARNGDNDYRSAVHCRPTRRDEQAPPLAAHRRVLRGRGPPAGHLVVPVPPGGGATAGLPDPAAAAASRGDRTWTGVPRRLGSLPVTRPDLAGDCGRR